MEEWRPPSGLSGKSVRKLNEEADCAATECLEHRWFRERRIASIADASAKTWVHRALTRLQRAERQYIDQWLPDRRL